MLGYEQYLAKDPKNAWVRYQLGELFVELDRLDRAEQAFRQSLADDTRVASARNALGVIALKRGDMRAGGAGDPRRASQQKPDVKLAHFNLALIAEARGDLATAAREYQVEIDTQPNAFKAAFNLGKLHEQRGNVTAQEAAFRKSIELNPDFAEGYFYLAKFYLDQGRQLDEAARLARHGLEIGPRSLYAPLGHYVLADLYSRRGLHADAEGRASSGKGPRTRSVITLPPSHQLNHTKIESKDGPNRSRWFIQEACTRAGSGTNSNSNSTSNHARLPAPEANPARRRQQAAEDRTPAPAQEARRRRAGAGKAGKPVRQRRRHPTARQKRRSSAPKAPAARKAPAHKPVPAPAEKPLRILMVTSEAHPFAKTGGLAEVAAALPAALGHLGHTVTLVLPRYRGTAPDARRRREKSGCSWAHYSFAVGFVEQQIGERRESRARRCAGAVRSRRTLFGAMAATFPTTRCGSPSLSRAALEYARLRASAST